MKGPTESPLKFNIRFNGYSETPIETIQIKFARRLIYCLQKNSAHMRKGMLWVTIVSVFVITIPIASADYSGEVEYTISESIFEIEFYSSESWTNDAASEIACWIDEEYGNNDSITSESEIENYEEYERAINAELIGTEGYHYLNGAVAIIDEYEVEVSSTYGNCNEFDLFTISWEGKFSFDAEAADEYVLLFNTSEDHNFYNIQVHYCIFEDFDVQSVNGLADESIDEECVNGLRINGEVMEIKFEKPQGFAIPSVSYVSTILVIFISSAFFARRTEQAL